MPHRSVKRRTIGSSRYDFRDPKIWRKEDGTYACVAGNRPADGSGQILLYTSKDGFQWDFRSVLVSNHDRFGKMWECPDIFELDGEWVLLTSPQDMLPKGFESIDYGIDFYAPQTVLAPDGRRIMIGWMQNWDACNLRAPDAPWLG